MSLHLVVMRWLLRVLIFVCMLVIAHVRAIQVHENFLIDNSRMEGSCMTSQNNFNRSCIYHKIVYWAQKIPLVAGWSTLRAPVGSLELIKLPEYATSALSVTQEKPKSRSFVSNFISLVSKTLEYFLDSYGIKVPLPMLSRNFPGIIIEEYSSGANESDPFDEGRHKKKHKKFALVFPLIAAFKFILIKALLIPILMGIIAIKKMLLLAAAAVPAVIALLRICRFPGGFGGFFGPGGLTAAAAAAPLVGTPYVASDTIISDFSSYAPALAAQQTSYFNKQQEYGGKSLNPFSQLTNY